MIFEKINESKLLNLDKFNNFRWNSFLKMEMKMIIFLKKMLFCLSFKVIYFLHVFIYIDSFLYKNLKTTCSKTFINYQTPSNPEVEIRIFEKRSRNFLKTWLYSSVQFIPSNPPCPTISSEWF